MQDVREAMHGTHEAGQSSVDYERQLAKAELEKQLAKQQVEQAKQLAEVEAVKRLAKRRVQFAKQLAEAETDKLCSFSWRRPMLKKMLQQQLKTSLLLECLQ